MLSLGKTGAATVSAISELGPTGFSAPAVDIGAGSLAAPSSCPSPTRTELSAALDRYREFRKMEHPRNWSPGSPDLAIPSSGEEMSRAVAEAIYGAKYYQNRDITKALDAFAEGVL